MADQWGSPMDDATVHARVQRVGARAEAQTQARLKTAPQARSPERAPSDLVVRMSEGWLARYRGPGWGQEKTPEPRGEWHALKTGVFYRHEPASVNQQGRGLLAEKVVVSWQGDAGELGARRHQEARRRGVGCARPLEAVGDGAPWIGNLVSDRWGHAEPVLDFDPASEHLWELGRALHPRAADKVKPWVERRLHSLRQGQERAVLNALARWKPKRGATGKIVRVQPNYFATHAGRLA